MRGAQELVARLRVAADRGSNHAGGGRSSRLARVELDEVQADLVGIGLAEVLEERRDIARCRRVVDDPGEVDEGVDVTEHHLLDALHEIRACALARLLHPGVADLVGLAVLLPEDDRRATEAARRPGRRRRSGSAGCRGDAWVPWIGPPGGGSGGARPRLRASGLDPLTGDRGPGPDQRVTDSHAQAGVGGQGRPRMRRWQQSSLAFRVEGVQDAWARRDDHRSGTFASSDVWLWIRIVSDMQASYDRNRTPSTPPYDKNRISDPSTRATMRT